MVHLGSDPLGRLDTTTGGRVISVPGVAAAAVWVLGLLAGLVALATGHELMAGVALVAAIMSPWFGMAWASRTQRRKAYARTTTVPAVASYAGGWPAL